MRIVWYSEVKWNYLRTRKQNLLAHFPPNDKILFFQPFSFVNKNFIFPRKEENVYYVTLPTYRKSKFKTFDKLMSFSIFRIFFYIVLKCYANFWIRILLKKTPDCICISNIYYLSLINNNKTPIVWDFNDHPGQFGVQPSWAIQEFNKFINDTDNSIISSSIGITNYLNKEYNRLVNTIPNGVDLGKFNNNLSKDNLSPIPVIGYVGIISPWFFDFELVQKLAKHFNSCEIHLYGPCVIDIENQLDQLLQIPNISYHGEKPYDILPQIMNTFTVGIIPLYSTPEVRRLASGKFLQYLGVGIPVVSVWMDQYSKIEKNIFLSNTHSEFISSVEKALKHPFIPMNDDLREFDWKNLSKYFRNELKAAIG